MINRLIASSFFRVVEKLILIATALVLTPILITYLGSEHYGLWILLLASLGWFNLFELGCPTAVQRDMAIAIEKGDDLRVNQIFSTATCLFLGLSILACAGVLLLASFPGILGVSSDHQTLASMALAGLMLKVLLDIFANATHGIYSGHLRFDLDAKLNVVFTLIKSVAMIVSAQYVGLLGVVVSTMVCDGAMQVIKAAYAFRLHKPLRFSFSLVRLADLQHFFHFSKFIIAYDAAAILNTKSAPLLISYFFNLSAVAIFNVAERLARQIETALASLLGIFQPYLVRAAASHNALASKLYRIIDLYCFFSAVLFIPLMLLSTPFLNLWVGPEFAQSADIIHVLCLALMAKTVSIPIMDGLIASAEHKLASLSTVVGAIANVLLALWFAPELGLIGVALSFLIAQMLFEGIVYCFLAQAVPGIQRSVLLLKLARICGLYAAFYWLNEMASLIATQLSWLMFIGVAGLCTLLVASISWFVLLDTSLRALLASKCKALLPVSLGS
ncbi:oligosaccharide flippase family protein [Alteromonas oceanisediminis]|uniref:oligosaccharide flippase family protein n=1 Tax=Alteromonas oceanisediminis TaxID=2836180 RepID=UPI001BDA340A|nr:oligosaccharide flippase family protein [Alteromonas oceanisediminis]MBT0585671.1 oligosaccharide flippase family protein [Alteromonas oceanisediminis]